MNAARGNSSHVGADRLHARYDVVSILGGNGRVLLAHDTQLDHRVVLVALDPSVASDPAVDAALRCGPHPNLPSYRTDFVHDGVRYLVRDFVVLEPLAQSAGTHIAEVERELRSALAHLHALDPPVAHGGVTRENVFVVPATPTTPARAMLLGFAPGAPSSVVGDDTALTELTRALSHRSGRTRRRSLTAAAALSAAFIATLTAFNGGGIQGANLPARNRVSASPAPAAIVPLVDEAAGKQVPSSVAPVVTDVAPRITPAADVAAIASPPRLAVYTPSAQLGRFDVYRVGPRSPEFQRTTNGLLMGWTHIAPLGDAWLFFYRALDGEYGTAPVEPNGRLGYGDDLHNPEFGWTDVVAGGGQTVWLHNRTTGATRAMRYADGFFAGDARATGLHPADHTLVFGLDDRAVFYRPGDGAAIVAAVGSAGITPTTGLRLPRNWVAAAETRPGVLVGVTASGRADTVRWTGAEFVPLATLSVADHATRVVGFRGGAFLVDALGRGEFVRVDAAGGLERAGRWRVPPVALLAPVVE